MIHFASTVYVVSNQLKNYYVERNVSANKLHVISNGVDEKKINPCISSERIKMKYNLQGNKVFGFVGSFHYWHGVEQLQSLLLDILLNYDNTMFLMVGDGPLKQNMEHFIKKNKIKDKVILTGYVEYNKIPLYLAAMDIVLAPYPKHQIFYFSPIKLFEYMAAGKSVLASSIGQIKEIIEDGVNGILFEAGNYDDLLEKSILLLKDNSIREKIGRAARKTIEKNYSWRHTAEKLHRVIEHDIIGNICGVI
jgi:glycosyltransferase involved in cell wall biosynthesis